MACCAHALTRSCSWRNLMYLIVSNSTDDVSVWQKCNVQSEFTASKNERRESSLHLKENFCSKKLKNLVPSRKVTRSAAVLWSSLPASLWVLEPAFETKLSNSCLKPRAFYLTFAWLPWVAKPPASISSRFLQPSPLFSPSWLHWLLHFHCCYCPSPAARIKSLNSTDFTCWHL